MSISLLDQYGPWALIAGGSEGIGLSFARQLAAQGINLILLARRSEPLGAARAQLVADFPVEVRIHAMDITAEGLDDQLAQITSGLEIGFLLYNAGAVHGVGLFLDESLDKSRKLLALNCNGPVTLCHHLAGAMRERRRCNQHTGHGSHRSPISGGPGHGPR